MQIGKRPHPKDSIKKAGNQWSAEAGYDTTGGMFAAVKATVMANGDEVSLEFASSANNPVRLRRINYVARSRSHTP